MERKMHCAPQTKGNDSPKVSEAGKNFKSAKHQQQNKITSLDITTKHSQESSLSRINSDSRCAILTFLSFEPDGTWRILAVPVQCLNHVNLASGVTMDGLQLLFPPPLNRPKIDQCKGTRAQVPSSAYSVKQSYARRSFTNSNVRRRCQNKVANKVACKLNELPADSCAQSSLVNSSSPSLSTHSTDVVIPSDMCLSNTKEDKSLKKNSRKRTRKKVRQIKKQSSVDNGSTEREVHTEDYVCASLTSETCSSNDVDTNAPESSSSEDRSMKIDCERNEMNDKINVRDAPKHCESRVDEAVVNKETKDIQHVELCCFNEIQDSLVLDAVSIGSKSDESINGVHIGKPSNKASCGITSNSGDEYFLGQGLTNGGQNCVGNDKKGHQKRTMSKSSSFNKFGKENSHSVWQKVQKNGSSECGGSDLKKVNSTSSQFVSSTTEKDPSAIKNCNSVGANVVSGLDDKKHVKNKVGRKSKGKSETVPKKGHCNYSKKGSNINKAVLNDNLKVTIQQNDSSSFSSQEINQQESVIEFQTNGVEHESSEIVHSEQFKPDEPDIQKSLLETKNESIDIQDSSSVMPGENIGQSDMSDEQSQVDQTVKEVSSGSTQWKWIPVGKKDNGMSKSEYNSSSSEDSDEPSSKIFDLENGVEPKMDSFSLNHQDSTYTGQIDDKASCVGEGENHKPVEVNEEHRDKHEVANHMIYEFENQDMIENDSYRIARAVSDVCRVQLACEVVYKATGGPVAEFERLLHFSSPVICRSPNSLGCLTCAPDHSGDVSLCRHEVPAVSLGCLWQWYEKHGSYGLEIRAWDYEIPRTVGGGGHFPFRAYFVPSLSAVQLFKNHENQHVNNSEARKRFDNSEDSAFSGDLELLFEYFECEQPQQRRPLYERIQELIRGDIPIQSKTYGDSTKLDSINLRDIHPRSWYSVAWYPIYRIPDGNFRASFLTYHSLGHMVRRSANSDSPSLDSCIVSPAVGLQSYNAKGECWFQMNNFALTAEMLGINSSLFLKERLRTLEETASIMARAVVNKGNQISTNNHPDYEFFLSRRRY